MTDEMNGVAAPQAQPLDEWQVLSVKLLEDLLAKARAGEVRGLAIVVARSSQDFYSTGVLSCLLELSHGCDDMKDTIKGAIRSIAAQRAQEMAAAKPKILRPEPGFDPQRVG